MVLCDDDRPHERMLFLRDHGRLPGDVSFRSVEVAWKYKMSELQAALGRVQLDRIEELIERKRQIFGWYPNASPTVRSPSTSSCPGNGDVLDGDGRVREDDRRGCDTAAAALADANIATRPFFPPLSSLPAFADATDTARAAAANPVSYDLARRALNLPSALTLDEGQVDRVCSVVRRVCAPQPGDG